MDPNNAAYLALRNHPETTIRPIGSGSGEMRSPGNENEHSPRNMDENIFKQVTHNSRHDPASSQDIGNIDQF